MKKNIINTILINKIYIHIIIFTFVSLFFIIFPEIDIYFSSLFFNQSLGSFDLNQYWIFNYFFRTAFLKTLIGIYLAFFIFQFLKGVFFKVKYIYNSIVILLNVSISSGLIINLLFKNQFGRARPDSIIEFGGEKIFFPAFYLSEECYKNCSFSCGDASVGFMFFIFAFIFPKYFKPIMLFSLTCGTILGLVRIIMGRHFLSDVFVTGYVCFFVSVGIAFIFNRLSNATQRNLKINI